MNYPETGYARFAMSVGGAERPEATNKVMDDDFRFKNIGKPSGRYAQRLRLEEIVKRADESIAQFEKERAERLKNRVFRPVLCVRISEDYGKTWKLRALCDECASGIEPPTQRRKEGAAGARNCDWCGAINEKQ